MTIKVMIAWFFAASAYVVAFMQRMAPQSINAALMAEFSLDATGVSWLTAGYFWGYTVMQLPAGPLVDMVGIRKMALISLTVSLTSTLGFALSTNMSLALACRFLMAMGDALVFTILIKMVAQNFSEGRFGLMSGLSQSSGYLGGFLATAPLAFLVATLGWRDSLLMLAIVCGINLVGVFLFLHHSAQAQRKPVDFSAIRSVISTHVRSLASWGCAIANASHFFVVSTLAGVWGLPMVAHVFSVNAVQAGQPLALFMVGNVVGSIVIGSLIDKTAKIFMVLNVLFLLRLALILLLTPSLARQFGFSFLLLNFLVLGIISGGVIPVVLKCVKKVYTAQFMGTGASLSMTFAGVAMFALLPLLGFSMAQFAVKTDAALFVMADLTDQSFGVLVYFLIAVSAVGVLGVALMARKYADGKTS